MRTIWDVGIFFEITKFSCLVSAYWAPSLPDSVFGEYTTWTKQSAFMGTSLEEDIDWNQIRLVPRFLIWQLELTGPITEMGKLEMGQILGEDNVYKI